MPAAFIDKQTAVESSSISLRTLDRFIARGLPVFRTSPRGKILIRPDDLAAFLVRQPSQDQALDVLVDEVLDTMSAHKKTAGRVASSARRYKLKGIGDDECSKRQHTTQG